MAKKGKEFDLGGVRIQLDPLVLATRIVMRQKLLLASIALLGAIVTIGVYLRTPKRFEAHSTILIRYESFDESFLQKLLNVSVGYLGSDLEMMSIINELDLYAKIRARLPYEMALREMRKELIVRSQPRNIWISYMSFDPVQAERVVAFTTERLLSKMAELNEAPYNRKLEAIDRTASELEPKRIEAINKLYEFKNKHPEIAISIPDLVPASSPLRSVEDEIRKAEHDLAVAQAGGVVPEARSEAPKKRPETEASRRLRDLEAALAEAKSKYTESHPEVLRLKTEIATAEAAVKREDAVAAAAAGAAEVPVGISPEEAKKARVAVAQARLKELIQRKTDLETASIGKPKLQREWAELSNAASTHSSHSRALADEREKIVRDRLVAASQFEENFQLVDAARVPELPSEPNRQKFMSIGMAVTALLGLLIAAWREAMRQTFVDATEFEEQAGLQVFAVLPTINNKEA
jgi:capsular polysaccharide biosynthesis protein